MIENQVRYTWTYIYPIVLVQLVRIIQECVLNWSKYNTKSTLSAQGLVCPKYLNTLVVISENAVIGRHLCQPSWKIILIISISIIILPLKVVLIIISNKRYEH